MGNAAGNPRFRRPITRWWAPIGGDDVVTMDTKDPYTGDHTPLVKLDAKSRTALRESGIVVRKGKAYTGRIVLAGSPGAVVKVTLIWGKEAADRQTVTLAALGLRLPQVSAQAFRPRPTATTHASRSPQPARARFTSARSR